jgi:hypothetical protein
MWFSTSRYDNTNSAPFVTVAIAGHTAAGNYCECGAPGCICDPGEEMRGHSASTVKDSSLENSRKTKLGRASGLDFGTTAFLLGLAFFMWSRFRG